jgi:hypothetical protein
MRPLSSPCSIDCRITRTSQMWAAELAHKVQTDLRIEEPTK